MTQEEQDNKLKQVWASHSATAHYFGVSATSLNDAIKSGFLEQGIHYGVFPFMKGKRFNIHAIEKILYTKNKEEEKIDDLVDNLLK